MGSMIFQLKGKRYDDRGKPLGGPRKKRPRSTGMSKRYSAYINSDAWAIFRHNVLMKRGRTCERCGTDAPGVRHVHHLHYRRFQCEKPEDVQVLCHECHRQAHLK